MAMDFIPDKTKTHGSSTSQSTAFNESSTESWSQSTNVSDSVSQSSSETQTSTRGVSSGTTDSTQLTVQNRRLQDMLERIELQLKRIDEDESHGVWECSAYFLSDSWETAEMAAGTYKALMKGERSGVESSAINFWGGRQKQLPVLRNYLTHFVHPVFVYPSERADIPVTASSLVSGNELAIQMGLPRKSVCGFPVTEHAEFGKEVIRSKETPGEKSIPLGRVFNMGKTGKTAIRLDQDSLTMHTFITGSTGAGKTNTVCTLLNQLRKKGIPFLVVEPAKGEYKNLFGQFKNVTVYGTNPKKFAHLLRINPFRFPTDIHVLEHMDRLTEIFNVCWPMYAAMPAILKEAMERSYRAAGWNMVTSENPQGDIYPNFADLLTQIEAVISESQYSSDTKGDYAGALCTRIRSLTTGLNGILFGNDDLTDEELFDKNVIVDLSRVGSSETKSLIMGLMVMKLNEYRMTSGKSNQPLTHITVLEEAHNLLKRTSTDQSMESSNLLGKSVELLTNSIAEMRTYGEGFIIADQSPGLLDLSVIRNTNTKIILRLPEQSDRELVGLAAGLNEDQIQELSKLERGVAAVRQNDWIEPVLTRVDRCEIEEKMYTGSDTGSLEISVQLKQQAVQFLISGRLCDAPDFDLQKFRSSIAKLNLSASLRAFLEEQIKLYQDTGTLALWQDRNFPVLSHYVTDLLNARTSVEQAALTAMSNEGLTQKLFRLIRELLPNTSREAALVICDCLMTDLSNGKDEPDVRRRIYEHWKESISKGCERK